MHRRHLVALVAAAALLVVGCSASAETATTKPADPLAHIAELPIGDAAPDSCVTSLWRASEADVPDDLIHKSLDQCGTVDEWGYALSQHPGAFGLTESATLRITELQTACAGYETTAVCKDGKEQGLI